MEYPLVSYCLFAYNQEEFIEAAVISAFEQDYPNLEIIISDDCSKDKTFDIITSLYQNYKGHHEITINRNTINLGVGAHVNKVITKLTNSNYIVLAGGDDISLPERTSLSYQLLSKKNVFSVHFNAILINEKGVELNKNIYEKSFDIESFDIYKYYKYGKNINGSTKAFNKKIYSVFNELEDTCPTEDTTLTFRSLLLGNSMLSYKVVAKRRIHSNNLSGANNIYKIDYRKILFQYLIDLNYSFKNNIIDNEKYRFIKNQIYQYYIKNFATQKIIRLKNLNTIKYLFYIMFSSKYSIKFKAFIIKLFIKQLYVF